MCLSGRVTMRPVAMIVDVIGRVLLLHVPMVKRDS
jgi:hypothetical protein